MNRKKKINETLKKKQKKANAKLQKSNKPRYISKAERARLEQDVNQEKKVIGNE
jgi:Skp family chaperone for outer membrane proteins